MQKNVYFLGQLAGKTVEDVGTSLFYLAICSQIFINRNHDSFNILQRSSKLYANIGKAIFGIPAVDFFVCLFVFDKARIYLRSVSGSSR